jgi:hypothetical protein
LTALFDQALSLPEAQEQIRAWQERVRYCGFVEGLNNKIKS